MLDSRVAPVVHPPASGSLASGVQGVSGRRAFFFDRDGTVNVSPGPGYVLRWEQFEFAPGAVALLAWLKQQGWALVLVTSQQGVGKGLMTQEDLDHIHQQMQAHLAEHGADFDGIYACTGLDGEDPWRKPSPLMIQQACADLGLDAASSWNVGDKARDIEMGRAAGVCHNVHLGTGAAAEWEAPNLVTLLTRLQEVKDTA
jgi:D-glycero-D-manno-heptose 1,7-bisphosphate phosphatase